MAKKHKLPPGTWIEREMLVSAAYNALTGWAPQLLCHFLHKRRFETQGRKGKETRICTNRDSITFTYIEAEKSYGITSKRFARAIDELLEKGFVTVVSPGGAYKRDKSIFGISDKWLLWRKGTVFEQRKRENISRGFRNKKTNSTDVNAAIHTDVSAVIQTL